MALTPEVIKANDDLKDLSEGQVAAISALSLNDENAVISQKVGELHGGYDKDIKEISGIEKNQGEKSYDYAKRVLGEFKTKAESTAQLTTEIEGYKTQVTDLKKKIEEGNTDPVLKQQLADANGKIASLQSQYEEEKNSWEQEKEEFGSKLSGIKVATQFEKAASGLKFKAAYPETIQKTLLDSAKKEILSDYKTDWVGEEGKKVMVFRGADGEIVRNPANKQEPFTALELLQGKLKEVLDAGKNTPGGGTKPPEGGAGALDISDLAGAKTQVEADEIITNHLSAKGLTRGSTAFADEQKKLRDEGKVASLPIR